MSARSAICLTFAVALLTAIAQVSLARAHDPDDDIFSPAQRDALHEIIRDYILENPQVIIESVALARQRAEAEQEQQLARRLGELKEHLEGNPVDPTLGNPDADIVVVEFFDYQCGFCKRVVDPVLELVADNERIRLVFKEFPILGPESEIAAKAALAAKRQGAYLDFHVALMRLRGQLTQNSILQVARELGLDIDVLEEDMETLGIGLQIEGVRVLAEQIGISGTPAFVVGDTLVSGADLDGLKLAIETALADQ